jgi:hypothetical protein
VAVAGLVLVGSEVLLIRDWWRKRETPLIAMGIMPPELPVLQPRGQEKTAELRILPNLKYVSLPLLVTDVATRYIIEVQQEGVALWRQEQTEPVASDGQPVVEVKIPTAILKDGAEYIVAWQGLSKLSREEPKQIRYRVVYAH